MRQRRTFEEIVAEPSPIMYRSNGRYFFNHLGDNVTGHLRSSFPWEPQDIGDFDYLNGWTRLGKYFVNEYVTVAEMEELIQKRFGVQRS